MHKTSPIRRYVLLRHLDHGVPSPRWSMERIAGAQGVGAAARAAAQLPAVRDARP